MDLRAFVFCLEVPLSRRPGEIGSLSEHAAAGSGRGAKRRGGFGFGASGANKREGGRLVMQAVCATCSVRRLLSSVWIQARRVSSVMKI